MKRYAVIDVGSNTIRMSAMSVDGGRITQMFSKKITAGLAGYVRGDVLSDEGIAVACASLAEMRELLRNIRVDEVSAFATATLRNVSNSEEALRAVCERGGIHVELLSGEQEALMGYLGVRGEIGGGEGVLLDIGGGSTEISLFDEGGVSHGASFPLGSLNLFSKCVRQSILPNDDERRAMLGEIRGVFTKSALAPFGQRPRIFAVGGTARATLAVANHARGLGADNRTLTLGTLRGVRRDLFRRDHDAIDLMLKRAPDRLHTLLPGMMILSSLAKRLGGATVTVCSAGVREGWVRYRFLGER